MKAVLCILAAFYAVHAVELPDPTGILQKIVGVEKLATEIILKDLEYYQQQVFQTVELRVNSVKTSSMLEVEETVSSALDEVRKTIANARHEGTNLDACYDAAKKQLDTIGRNGHANLDTCVKNTLNSIEEPFRNIANTIQNGKQIITDLDAIIPDCYSSIYLKMQNCVLRKTLIMKTSVKRLQTNSRSVKRTATVSSISSLSKIRTCTTMTISEVRTNSTEIRVAAGTCVRNA